MKSKRFLCIQLPTIAY